MFQKSEKKDNFFFFHKNGASFIQNIYFCIFKQPEKVGNIGIRTYNIDFSV